MFPGVIDNLVVDDSQSSDEEDVPLSNKKAAKTKKGQIKIKKAKIRPKKAKIRSQYKFSLAIPKNTSLQKKNTHQVKVTKTSSE